MAVADEIKKSFASDGAKYTPGIQARPIGGSDVEALASWITEKKKARPSATRASVSAADAAGDISGNSSSAVDVGNSPHCAVFCEGTPASAEVEVFLQLFDESGNMVGITESYVFLIDSSYKNGSTNYISEAYVFDVRGAAKAWPVVRTIVGSTPSLSIFVKPL